MVSTPVKDRTPRYPPPEDGVIVKGECPRCHQIRHMFPDDLECSLCRANEELEAIRKRRANEMAGKIASLRQRRVRLGFTQREVAKRAGINDNTLTFIETGRTRYPLEDTMEWLEGALDELEATVPRPGELKEKRLALGIPLRAVSKEAGIPVSTLDKLERGVRRTRADKLLRIGKALDELASHYTTVEELFRRRKALGVSRYKLFEASGVREVTIWEMESGRRTPIFRTRRLLKEALDRIERVAAE